MQETNGLTGRAAYCTHGQNRGSPAHAPGRQYPLRGENRVERFTDVLG